MLRLYDMTLRGDVMHTCLRCVMSQVADRLSSAHRKQVGITAQALREGSSHACHVRHDPRAHVRVGIRLLSGG